VTPGCSARSPHAASSDLIWETGGQCTVQAHVKWRFWPGTAKHGRPICSLPSALRHRDEWSVNCMGDLTPAEYYRDPAVRTWIREFCGATASAPPTCAFVTPLCPGPLTRWETDAKSVLVHLDVDYFENTLAGEALLRRALRAHHLETGRIVERRTDSGERHGRTEGRHRPRVGVDRSIVQPATSWKAATCVSPLHVPESRPSTGHLR
jgi:hypothetical protein